MTGKHDLSKEIFLAQHFGNVSPEEFMVPYPNIPELLTGQNIKHSQKMVYRNEGLTNADLLEKSGKYANWLISMGIGFGDRVHISGIKEVDAHFLAYAVWRTGAVLVIGDQPDHLDFEINLLIDNDSIPEKETVHLFNSDISIPETQRLNDEALIILEHEKAVRLSHYNLLVNTVGIQQILGLNEDSTFSIDTEPWTLPWIILKVIMPLTSGSTLGDENAQIRIGSSEDKNCDYRIMMNWTELSDEVPEGLFFLNEAGGVLAVGGRAVPLLKFRFENEALYFQGHSVMSGYTSDLFNSEVFENGWVKLSLS